MKRFLILIFSFALPVITVLSITEFLIRKIPNEYSSKIKNFERQAPEIEVLVLGSSHALRGINPHDFQTKRAYNLAMVWQPLLLDHKLLFKYKDELPNLKCVIISISYFSLSKELDQGEIKERIPYYEHFYGLDINEVESTFPNSFSAGFAVGFKSAAARIYKFIRGTNLVETDSLGWMGAGGKLIKTEKGFIKDATYASKRHEDNSLDFEFNLELIREIIDFGERNKVKIILVNTPKTRWYNDLLNVRKSNLINQEIMSIIKNTNAEYLDLNNNPNFDLKDFRNSDHLNELGAKKLTKLVEQHIP